MEPGINAPQLIHQRSVRPGNPFWAGSIWFSTPGNVLSGLSPIVPAFMSEQISEEQLRDLKTKLGYFQAREARAAERLQRQVGRWFCFAIIGLSFEDTEVELFPGAVLRRVHEPPGEIELARGLHNQHLFSAVGRYSGGVGHELAIDSTFGSEEQAAFNLAWWVISALRVRCLPNILVPAVADYSWDTIAAAPANSCHVQLLEDVPQARRFAPDPRVGREDLMWVSSHILDFGRLLEEPRFRLAVDALTTHHHHHNLRVMTALLWSGVEGLFAINAELTFRLAAYASVLLEPAGPSRHQQFAKLKAMYSTRSKVVHGSVVKAADLEQHVIEVRGLLSRLLRVITEEGGITDVAEIERRLFCEVPKVGRLQDGRSPTS